MTDRKTLKIRVPSEQDDTAPALKKKGRGWEISEKRLDALHERAREMRRFASPANKALAKRFADADMGRYTFKRFAVVGSAIVDFNCHPLGMAIIIEEPETEGAPGPEISKRRDKSLESVGIRVMRIKAEHILENMDGVLQRITLGMRMRIEDKRQARREHHRNSTPRVQENPVSAVGSAVGPAGEPADAHADAPAGDTPETLAPETLAPETTAPETAAPEAIAAQTTAPESAPAAAPATPANSDENP